jgi:rubrerythrin
MNDVLNGQIASVAEFLAHALEMEAESAERYRELADTMEVHNNPEVAALFRRLALESETHTARVRHHGAMYDLPGIAPWAFKWSCEDGPESIATADVHYLMSRRQAIELALHNERRGLDFYKQVAQRSSNADVRRLAAQLAEEEDVHVDLLKEWLAKEPDSTGAPVSDLDPPNSPE